MSPARTTLESSDSLIQYTYGLRGRWLRSEAARRLLDRVIVLNRAALLLLAAISTGASRVSGGAFAALSGRRFRVPARALDGLGEALPPIAVPDFARLAELVIPVAPSLEGDESIERYQLLFAEMLSLAGRSEVRS
jgi:hypothetical protein